MRYTISALFELKYALGDVLDYLTDNSCGDPDCCGEPYVDQKSYEDGVETLRKYGITFDPDTLND